MTGVQTCALPIYTFPFYLRNVHGIVKRKSIGGSFLSADIRPADRRHPVTAPYLGNSGSMAGRSNRRGNYVRCIYGLSFPLSETVHLLKTYLKNICPAAGKKKPLLGSPFSMHKIISCGGSKLEPPFFYPQKERRGNAGRYGV